MKKVTPHKIFNLIGIVLLVALVALMVYGSVSASAPAVYAGNAVIVNASVTTPGNSTTYSFDQTVQWQASGELVAVIYGYKDLNGPTGSFPKKVYMSTAPQVSQGTDWYALTQNTNGGAEKSKAVYLSSEITTAEIASIASGYGLTPDAYTEVTQLPYLQGETYFFHAVLSLYSYYEAESATATYVMIPVYAGELPQPTATATTIPEGQGWCPELPAGTPVSAYDPVWIAQCAECIPEETAVPTSRPLEQHLSTFEIPEMQLTCEPGKCIAPTKQPTPTIPAICSTPPALRDDTPVVPVNWGDLAIRQGECYDIIPQAPGGGITIPEFSPLGVVIWDEFSIGWEGYEICVNWVTLPEMRIFDFEVPSSLFIVVFIGILLGMLGG